MVKVAGGVAAYLQTDSFIRLCVSPRTHKHHIIGPIKHDGNGALISNLDITALPILQKLGTV